MLANIFSIWKTFLWTLLVWLTAQAMGRTLRLVLFNHVRKLSLIRSHFVHSEENSLDILLISWFNIKEICVRKECGMSSLDLKCDNTKAILRNESNNFDSGCSPFLPLLPSKINQLFKERFLLSAHKYRDGKVYCLRESLPDQMCNFFEHCSKSSWRHISSESLFGLLILFCKSLKSLHEPIGFRFLRCRHI